MDRRRFLSAAAGAAAGTVAGVVGGCNRAAAGESIKIVSSMPRTGPSQGQTDTIANGIRMAIDEFNGQVAGFAIKYEDKDDATASGFWDANLEATNARQAVADPDCVALIGPYNSGAAVHSMPVCSEAGLLQISPACTSVELTKKVPGDKSGKPEILRPGGKLTFVRVCPNDGIQGTLSAVFAHEALKAKKVYVLDDKELYGLGISSLFKKKCEELGVQVLGHESIIPKQANYKTLLSGIAEKKPDLLYFGGSTHSSGPQIAIDMKGLLTCPLMVPDGCYEEAFIKGAGADLFDSIACYATTGAPDLGELKGPGAGFVKNYEQKYGRPPESYAVYGYEAAKVLLEAVKAVGKKDREAIRDAVVGTKDFDKGALGKWGFDADGDTTLKALTISKVVGGQFKPVKSVFA